MVKDRKKDLATAKLTDVQALQQQVALMEQVTRFLRAENERRRADPGAVRGPQSSAEAVHR